MQAPQSEEAPAGSLLVPLKDVELLLVLRSDERKPPRFSTDGPSQSNPSSQLLSDACVGRWPSRPTGFPQKSASAPAAEYSPFCPRHGRLRFSSSPGRCRDLARSIGDHLQAWAHGQWCSCNAILRQTHAEHTFKASNEVSGAPIGTQVLHMAAFDVATFSGGGKQTPEDIASLPAAPPPKICDESPRHGPWTRN